jgi:hypothetical protein
MAFLRRVSFASSERKASDLMQDALHIALKSAGLQLSHLDGLIAVPSLAEPRFMEAHYIGTTVNNICDIIINWLHSHEDRVATTQECCCQNYRYGWSRPHQLPP